jgi:hypothetical protein
MRGLTPDDGLPSEIPGALQEDAGADRGPRLQTGAADVVRGAKKDPNRPRHAVTIEFIPNIGSRRRSGLLLIRSGWHRSPDRRGA